MEQPLFICERDITYKLFAELAEVTCGEIGRQYLTALVFEDQVEEKEEEERLVIGKRIIGLIPRTLTDRLFVTERWFIGDDSVSRRLEFLASPDKVLFLKGMRLVIDWNSATSIHNWDVRSKESALNSLEFIGIKPFVYERKQQPQCSINDSKVIEFLLGKTNQ